MYRYDLSIIIPMYNSEASIKRCLLSVSNHSERTQIILVDDGSTDNSVEVAESVMQRDENFVIYHQKNSGVSVARNFGIKVSEGKWLIFLDSDDVMLENWEQSCLSAMNSNPEEVDEIVFDAQATRTSLPSRDALFLTLGIPTEVSYGVTTMFSVWSKMYRAEFVHVHNILFRPGISNGEDMLFNCSNIVSKARIKMLNSDLLRYRKNYRSSSNSFDELIFRNERHFSKELEFLVKPVISISDFEFLQSYVSINAIYVLLYRIAISRQKEYLASLVTFIKKSPYKLALQNEGIVKTLDLKHRMITDLLNNSQYNTAFFLMRAIVNLKFLVLRIKEIINQ